MDKPIHILSKEQDDFLKSMREFEVICDNYYLTGGTPLSAFYLYHRYSEDLDFFIESQEVNLLAIQKVIKSVQKALQIKQVTYQNHQGLHIFFLTYPNNVQLKVDFNYYPFPRIKEGVIYHGITLDSLLDIAVNKIQTIATRTAARDFIDLYFAVQKMGVSVHELIQMARNKFDWYIEPIQFGKQFIKVGELRDYPRMIKKLDTEALKQFYLKEAKRLDEEIFKT